MSERDDRVISITPIPKHAGPSHQDPGAVFPPKPVPRPRGPRMTTPPVTIRADGGLILSRKWDGKAWGSWDVLSEQDLQLMIGERPAPPRRPYVPGT